MPEKAAGTGCQGCRNGTDLPFDFSMAFQPIVDVPNGRVWGYEALVRGTGGEPAWHVLSQVDAENRYRFDQACRVKAIETAARLFPRSEDVKLSINFMPNAVYEPCGLPPHIHRSRPAHRHPARADPV
jgi:EAL domain-containing protein (putative c-di-GMP-specific phosphodiesterase class I)